MATKINKKKLKKDIYNINYNLTNLEKELKKLNTDLDKMMKGNADGPYWNGESAKKFYTSAVKNIKNDINDYVAAYNKLNVIAEKYEQLVSNDK